MTFICVIIAAGGRGERFKDPKGKQLALLDGKPVLSYSVSAFRDIASQIIIVVDENILINAKKIFSQDKVVAGGKERSESVKNGLKEVSSKSEIILVHDGARPLVTRDIIKSVIDKTEKEGAAVPAVLVKDTIKLADKNDFVDKTLDRSFIWAVQTPQGFRADIIRNAYNQDIKGSTDDAFLVEKMGGKIKIVEGRYSNIKITTPEDLVLAKEILKENQSSRRL